MSVIDSPERRIRIGHVAGVHGLQGWLKIFSYCDPREALFDYRPLRIGERVVDEYEGKRQGKGLLLRPAGALSREDVEALIGAEIHVLRSQLPAPEPGSYYHADLVGLRVENRDGEQLGSVVRVLPGAANDVLLVDDGHGRELLIPFTPGHTVDAVDLATGLIQVDWERDWA